MKNSRLFPLFLFPLLAGCVATTTDVDRLQDSLSAVQKGQADLIVKMNELDRSILGLGEKLGDNKEKTAALARQLEDIHARLGERMQIISTLLSQATTYASVAVPGDSYRTAYADYQSGRTDLAVSGFLSFLDRYPDSNLADSAQFYLADCYLIKKDFARARAELDKLLAVSKEFRAQALLKRSYSLAGLKQPAAQEETLKALLKEFPSSPEAETAKQILEEFKTLKKP